MKALDDLDGLRLYALGRVPRCAPCPRYQALCEAHRASSTAGGSMPSRLPPVPEYCHAPYCTPLAARYARQGAA